MKLIAALLCYAAAVKLPQVERAGQLERNPDYQSCSALRNEGSHSTVRVKIGTPPQELDVIVDTGSDYLIIQSCMCQAKACAKAGGKCFIGTNTSSTFSMTKPPPEFPGKAVMARIVFGSGPVECVVASDIIQVGAIKASLVNTLLMMVDHQLNIISPIEGIMGLGLPIKHSDKPFGTGFFKRQGFLETAGITSFSLCFNEKADGALRLQVPLVEPIGTIGKKHWGTGFLGVSVGDAETKFCRQEDMTSPTQKTPCGVIYDSGNTVMMAHPLHLITLFEQLCDGWERCRNFQTFAETSGDKSMMDLPKHHRFQVLLYSCEMWMAEGGSMSELPPLTFHITSNTGARHKLVLNAYDYIFQMDKVQVNYVTKYLMGVFPIQYTNPTGKHVKTCAPAFGAMQYLTEENGPVWILGTPLYYKYQVQYDLQEDPPLISFKDAPCGSCQPDAMLLETAQITGSEGRSLRQLTGPLRVSWPLNLTAKFM